jgi:hypothetical protein
VSLEGEGSTTCAELQCLIQQVSNIPPLQQELLSGFPPKPLQVSLAALRRSRHLHAHNGEPLAGCMDTHTLTMDTQTAA